MIARRRLPVKQNLQSFLHCCKIAENRRKTQKRCNFNLQIGCGLDRQNDLKCAPRSAGKVTACLQRAGTLRWARGREGCSDSPPPYLWTPPTPQRAKGCSPLTILKRKSKHKKASAAPVGAIALTLFFASPFIAPQSLRDSSPEGEQAPPAAPRFRRKRRCKCHFPLRPLP